MSNPRNRNLDGCPRCDGMIVVDPSFLYQAQTTLDRFLVELVTFAKKHRLDHNNMPILSDLGQVIQELKNLG